jgi:hypothetical protein
MEGEPHVTTKSTPVPSSGPAAGRAREEAESLPWVSTGIQAGLIGASVVALFFLVVDVLAGRPFWTPYLLGSALFLGELPGPDARPQPLLWLAYTAVHVTVFIGFAVPAAFWALAQLPSARAHGRASLLALVLFLGFEVVFLTLAELFTPGLTGMLGAGRVAAANALAAIAMAAFIAARAGRREARA